ncbi:MAG TPA: hypothetical protein VII47_15870 [Actinomycetota bacterium]|jgi:hypothetical protein
MNVVEMVVEPTAGASAGIAGEASAMLGELRFIADPWRPFFTCREWLEDGRRQAVPSAPAKALGKRVEAA